MSNVRRPSINRKATYEEIEQIFRERKESMKECFSLLSFFYIYKHVYIVVYKCNEFFLPSLLFSYSSDPSHIT